MMADRQAVIIGYDAVSPLGVDLDEQWSNALGGVSGIGELTRFPVREGYPVRIAGQVGEVDTSPYPFLGQREMANWTSPIYKHAMLVVHRALGRSGIEITPELAPGTAVTFSSAVGGLDAVVTADRKWVNENKLPHPFTNPNSCINMVGGKVSILTGATGPITSVITACATGVTSVIMGAMMLNQGVADVAICGAVDFALIEPIVAGFATMNGAFRPRPNQPETAPDEASCPFSINRRGFVISEGAGAIIIATKEFAKNRGIDYRIEIAGWGMTSDATHFVAPNTRTVAECMVRAVSEAGIQPGDIDAVNAHAASTRIGDKVEFDAMKQVFGDRIPPVAANKSMTGHAMGASSAIESIFAIRGMIEDILPPTINYVPDPAMELDCVSEGARRHNQEFVLKNALGFGGCNTCVVFRKVA